MKEHKYIVTYSVTLSRALKRREGFEITITRPVNAAGKFPASFKAEQIRFHNVAKSTTVRARSTPHPSEGK